MSLVGRVFGKSKGEVRRLIKMGGVSINGERIMKDEVLSEEHILFRKYILVKVGKKNHCLVHIQSS